MACRKIAELLLESQDRRLSFPERLSLRVHLLLCKGCARFRDQLAFLSGAVRTYLNARRAALPAPSLRLSADARARIQMALDQES